ncbi:MAG: biotin--[acetyl-CoA-carboxylase] ligase [Chloroflexi bacterium]|nr:biotin--[acetyl-CoA-carboxylase] ligase [Chloroflexota bacterium]
MDAADTAMAAGEPLDHALIRTRLANGGGLVGVDLVYLPVAGSTNDVAGEMARIGASHGTTVVADAQTAGRGRRGKAPWQSPPGGSIAMSVIVRLQAVAPERLGRIAIAVAVAVGDAITSATGLVTAVKWPNDIVTSAIGDVGTVRKLGGILIEPALGNHPDGTPVMRHAIVGIGINANVPVSRFEVMDQASLAPASLSGELGGPVSREDVIVGVLRALDHVGSMCSDTGWIETRQRYEVRLAWRGRPVVVGFPVEGSSAVRRPVAGELIGIDGSGALTVRDQSGTLHVFHEGDVRVRTTELDRGVRLPVKP